MKSAGYTYAKITKNKTRNVQIQTHKT